MFDHQTLSMPDEFMSPIFTHDNDAFNHGHHESSDRQYNPANDHGTQYATTVVQNMFSDTDKIELPASVMNFLDDFQNLPTPQSFSNLFEDALPSSNSEDMTTDTTMAADVMTVDNTSYTIDTPYGTQLTLVMLPFHVSTLINTHPYPPTNMVGSITEHDRPYSKYGHLDQNTLRRKFRFDVSAAQTLRKRRAKKCRLARKMYAVICHSNISNGDFIEIGDFKSHTSTTTDNDAIETMEIIDLCTPTAVTNDITTSVEMKQRFLNLDRRLCILPCYPTYNAKRDTGQPLLANIPYHQLTSTELSYRRSGAFKPACTIANSLSNMPSFLREKYNMYFGDLLERLKVDLSILDYNYTRLNKFIRMLAYEQIRAFNLQPNAIPQLEEKEYPTALEFFLQFDVNLFYMKTCSFRHARPRTFNEGLFCLQYSPNAPIHLGMSHTEEHELLLYNTLRFELEERIRAYHQRTQRLYPINLVFDLFHMDQRR
ncbi:unnamed protein product [Rotaria sp. Silwood1]|nr:unnamed protein product [Rotaria sp. Silwood1]CAF3771638.1 unnamed protein product [Rotaria sp. Silwood1]